MRIARENQLLRVHFTSRERARTLPAYEALIARAEEAGCRGATVLRGVEGLAPGGRRLRPRPWSVAEEVPVVVEVIDTPGRIDAVLVGAADLLTGRTVTRERAAVLIHRVAPGRGGPPEEPAGRTEVAMAREQAGVLVRVFLSESDRHGGRPLAREILDRAAAAGVGTALVLKSPAGYGAHRTERSSKVEAASLSSPLVVELVDAEETMRAFLPRVEEILREGLVTVEKVTLLRFP